MSCRSSIMGIIDVDNFYEEKNAYVDMLVYTSSALLFLDACIVSAIYLPSPSYNRANFNGKSIIDLDPTHLASSP